MGKLEPRLSERWLGSFGLNKNGGCDGGGGRERVLGTRGVNDNIEKGRLLEERGASGVGGGE